LLDICSPWDKTWIISSYCWLLGGMQVRSLLPRIFKMRLKH
jgi:hypothetical protein